MFVYLILGCLVFSFFYQRYNDFVNTVMNICSFVSLSIQKAKLSIGHHGERSLESFCHWQNEEYGGAKYLGNNQVPGARDDTPPVDAAVFVTRYNEARFIGFLKQYWPIVCAGIIWFSSLSKKKIH